jgi:type II secretory pathway pseudopilin PulG
MNTTDRRHVSGQTLLELVVALGIVALVLTGLIAAVTSSLRYGQASRFRSRGVKYAQEGIEIVRKLRDTTTWDAFVAYSGSGTSSWCLDEGGVWSEDSGIGCPIAAGSQFWRTIIFTWNTSNPGSERMEVTSDVSWADRSAPSTVTLETYFTQWK